MTYVSKGYFEIGRCRMDLTEIKQKLSKYNQEHLLRFYDELDKEQQQELLSSIARTDFDVLVQAQNLPKKPERGVITPIKSMELPQIEARESEYREVGIKSLQRGEVAALLLAGGMGTRLGSDEPKGVYDIGLTRHVYIFQRLIENLMEVVDEAGCYIPLYIMTSEKNHDRTVEFLKEHEFFGYREDYVSFFKQEMAPATDYDGKVFLEEKWRMSTSPNGNGGWYISMHRAGLVKDAIDKGIKWINIFTVDNVLQRICDPVFIGAVEQGGYVSGSKVVKKVARDEKVGAICLEDGRPSIVEYYDMTDELMDAKDDRGEPAYNFGVILNYLFSIEELERIRECKLPLHIVNKKIQHIDDKGQKVEVEAPNGYKYEKLVLDMIHEMKNTLPFEVKRDRDFAPIKNRIGVDSVESARELCRKNGIEL